MHSSSRDNRSTSTSHARRATLVLAAAAATALAVAASCTQTPMNPSPPETTTTTAATTTTTAATTTTTTGATTTTTGATTTTTGATTTTTGATTTTTGATTTTTGATTTTTTTTSTTAAAIDYASQIHPQWVSQGCTDCHVGGNPLDLSGTPAETCQSIADRDGVNMDLVITGGGAANSLLIRKPSAQVAHVGGLLACFAQGASCYNVTLDWLQNGAPGPGGVTCDN